MATNYHQDGDVLTLTAPAGGVTSGQPLTIGTINGVALVTAAAGEEFACRVSGVFLLPAAEGLEQGDAVTLTDGELAEAAAGADIFGKVVLGTADGVAAVRLSN